MINRIVFANRCPSEDDWQALLSGDLAAPRQSEMEAHLDRCHLCLEVVELLTPCLPAGLEEAARARAVPNHQENEYWRAWAAARPEAPQPSADEDARLPFERGGDYQSRGEIGRGGMGVVYKAWQPRLYREVAIKMISERTRPSDDAAAQLKRERQRLAILQHPNIVRLYDAAEQDGTPYFTMELVDGRTLTQVGRDAPFQPRHAAELVMTIAKAVQYAHDKRVMHLDLKPGNILLTAGGTPMITDFGLAKTLDDVTAGSGREVAGTAEYMSPEQWLGDTDNFCERTDVYGIGTILYELLVGRPPVSPSRNRKEVRRRVLTGKITPPRQIRRSIPKDLEAICLRCLQKMPEDRYGSAQEVADSLARFLNGYPLETCSLAKRVRYLLRRNLAITAVACAGVLVAAVSLAYLTSYWNQRQTSLAKASFIEGQEAAGKGKVTEGVTLMHQATNLLPPSEAALGRYYRRSAAAWEAWRVRCKDTHQHNSLVTAAAASANGRYVLIGDAAGKTTLWDRENDSVQVLPTGQKSPQVYAVAFDRTNTYCASAYSTPAGSQITVWNMLTSRKKSDCVVEPRWVRSLALLGDNGTLIATGTADKAARLRLWDTSKGTAVNIPMKTEGIGVPLLMVCSPAGERFASVSLSGECWLWSSRTGEAIADISLEVGFPVSAAAFSEDGSTLAAAGKGLALCEGDSGVVRRRLSLINGQTARSIAFRGDEGLTLVLESNEKTLVRRGTADMDAWDDIPIDLMNHSAFVDSLSGGDLLISGVRSQVIQLWEMPRFEQRTVGIGNDVGDIVVAVSRATPRFVTLSWPMPPEKPNPSQDEIKNLHRSQILIWDSRTLTPLHSVTELPEGVVPSVIELSPSGDTLAIGCDRLDDGDGQAPVFLGKLSPNNTISILPLGKHKSDVMAVAFTRDGRKLMSGCLKNPEGLDAELICWNHRGGEEWKVPYPVTVKAIAISPDERWVAVGGNDGVLRFYTMAGAPLPDFDFPTGNAITAAAFSNRQGLLAVANGYGKVAIFQVSGPKPVLIEQLAHPGAAVSEIAFSQNDELLYVGMLQGELGVACYDAGTWQRVGPTVPFNSGITSFGVAANLPAIFATTNDGRLVKRAILTQK